MLQVVEFCVFRRMLKLINSLQGTKFKSKITNSSNLKN
ncbi:hypothetical protein X975_02957, partial [Stegodyphus mimosarum]